MSESSAKVMYVNRRTIEQKSVKVEMTDGRYGHNSVEITWVGLPPSREVSDIVDQAWNAMDRMQKLNAKHLSVETKTDKLPEANSKKRLEGAA